MAETLETATATDLALDYDVPIDIELSSGDIELSGDILIEIDPEINFDDIDFVLPSFDLGVYWPCGEVYVKTIPYLPADAETPIVPDLA